jgi:hypothetical protein
LVSFAKYNENDRVKMDELGKACRMNARRIWIRNQERMRPVGTLRL